MYLPVASFYVNWNCSVSLFWRRQFKFASLQVLKDTHCGFSTEVYSKCYLPVSFPDLILDDILSKTKPFR